ncbi:MAG: T9SS type A sorting domain-containing protein, partial [Bacteroidota bacterium]|nr:T9SS type A sorting domain-containing protein [Bacteroidota bacterium]
NLVYSGNAFATGQTDPGVYMYYATQTSGYCESLATTVSLTIHELPVVELEAFAPVCINVAPFALSGGSPTGGSYSGPGVTDNTFDPAAAGAGTHDIGYSYTDENGCSNDAVKAITVNDLPAVSLAVFSDLCLDSEPLVLTGGTPEGGTYIGEGIEGGVFYPEEAGAGIHGITYVYTDENGCENSAMQEITVNDLPNVNIGPDSQLCAGLEITLDATTSGATSYEWYPGGETTAQITVDSTGIGVGSQMFICYVTDGNDCVSSDTVIVEFEDCSAINELAGVNNIILYPNPGQGIVSLQIDTDDPVILNIKVYNNRGTLVLEKQNIRVENTYLERMDLSGQASGVYLVTVSNNEGIWVEKLIVRN